MLIEGKFPLTGAVDKVFKILLEPEVLAACIPGAQSIKRIDDRNYDCVVEQRVGPISVTLVFRVNLAEVNPPVSMHAVGSGADTMKAATFTLDMRINTTQTSRDQVEVAYKVNVNITGKLATFGDRIMRAKAKQVGDEFQANLQSKLKSRLAAEAAA